MTILFYKRFGKKIFLHNLNDRIVKDMLSIPRKDSTNKIPNFGTLVRFEKDDTVGISVQWIDKNGHSHYSYEFSQHKTIYSWARFHTFDI